MSLCLYLPKVIYGFVITGTKMSWRSLVVLGWLLVPFLLQCGRAQDMQDSSAESSNHSQTDSPLIQPASEELRLVSFQASEAASTNSSLRLLPDFPEMAAVTLNLWVRFRHFSPALDIIVSYFGFSDDLLHLWNDMKNKELVFRVYGYKVTAPLYLPLYMWNHIVISFDISSTDYHLLVNDQEINSSLSVDYESRAGKNLPGGGVLVLGQDQDSLGGGFSVTQSFSGELADFCLLPRYFPLSQLGNFSCLDSKDERDGIFLDRIVEWDVIGDVKTMLINKTMLTYEKEELFVLLPEKKYFSEAFKLCEVLGFPMALPTNEEENVKLYEKAVALEPQCLSAWSTNVWIGSKGNLTTKRWQNLYDGSPITYDNLDEAYSYVSASSQCITMGSSLYPKIWYNTACSKYDPCPACENSPVDSVKVRGLCKESHVDREMHIHGTMNLKPIFRGNFYTKMWWNTTTWVMASRLLPQLKAMMILKEPDDYPVGLHQWLISGDDCPAEKVDLLLTVCGEESFPCNDGTCVHMSQRCDLRAHCDDGSDEMECDKVFVGTDYEKTLPPPPPETEDVLNVTLSVVITAVRTLNLLDQAVTLDVQLMSQWKDSRLKYADLQPEQFKNQIQEEDRLWLTNLIITDDSGSLVDLVKRGSSVVVIRDSDPLPSDDTSVVKAAVFPGSENALLLLQELSVTFQCQFNLQWFPFDNQRCSLNLRLNDVESNLVRLTASEPQYLGPKKLTEYEVRTVTMAARQRDSGQKLTLVFTNLFLYYLANSYLPSFLLVVISYSTFYFRLEDFNERIMVSITAMLVLVALFQQTSSTILKTTYLKLIDVWYMVCIIVDFVMVILLVVIDFARHLDDNTVKVVPVTRNTNLLFHDNKPRNYNMLARMMLPLLFAVFLTIYATVSAVQYFGG